MARAHVFVSGKVQGVFFRDGLRTEAHRLGLSGWVHNLADGRVEAVLEGQAAPLAEALAWLKHGPPSAQVERVEVIEDEPEGGLQGFDVLPNAREPGI
ncbi:MAG: acylphosphatase [Thermoplasmatota archaeon]